MNSFLVIHLISTIAVIFALDAVDGYIARKRSETSKLGEVLDTLTDRIIENTFWVYFTATGQLPVWMPIVVMARGFITDAFDSYFSIGHSTRLLNFAADGECACDGKEVSAFFDAVVMVTETEVEVCCGMCADALRTHQLAFEGAACMTGMI